MRVNKLGSWVFISGIILAFTGLFISSFTKVTSIGTLLLGVSVLLSFNTWRSIPRAHVILFVVPVLFAFTNFTRSGVDNITVQEFYVTLGMLLTAFSCLLYHNTIDRYKSLLGVIFLGTIALVNLSTLANYFTNKAELDELLLQSKSIPISLGMHHIHFGVINALSLACIAYALMFFKQSRSYRAFLLISGTLILISFHILSSRTGLLAFHSAFLASLLFYALSERKFKLLAAGVLTIIALNALAFSFSTSFRNKISNSMEDMESWGKGDEINYKSMAMRMEAYKVSYLAMQDKPLSGHGAKALDSVLQEKYIEIQTPLYSENRVGPHNQYLEYGLKYGLIGMVFILCFYLYWIVWSIREKHYGLFFIACILAISCLFESLHERQVSAFVVACSLPVIFMFKPAELTSGQH